MIRLKTSITVFICIFNLYTISAQELRVKDGWLLKKTKDEIIYKRFFPLALWGIPGYTFTHHNRKEKTNNKEIFISQTKEFDFFYSHSQNVKDYMQGKTLMMGSSEFPWYLRRLINNTGKKTKDLDLSVLEQESNQHIVMNAIGRAVNNLYEKSNGWNTIWAPIDEVASWSPTITNKIYTQIKQKDKNAIVYIDLLGNGRKMSYKNRGLPIIQYEKIESIFVEKWYNNVKRIASEYKNSGDVFGLNSYGDFYRYPLLAGLAVDAIKEGIGKDVPIWLWFDITGFSKPQRITYQDYVKCLKSQLYTSIIHGATGAMFWNNGKKEDEFKEFLPIIKMLNKQKEIFTSKTIDSKINGDFQYIIKRKNNGRRYIIAVNINKKNSIFVMNSNINKRFLEPLEVYIAELK